MTRSSLCIQQPKCHNRRAVAQITIVIFPSHSIDLRSVATDHWLSSAIIHQRTDVHRIMQSKQQPVPRLLHRAPSFLGSRFIGEPRVYVRVQANSLINSRARRITNIAAAIVNHAITRRTWILRHRGQSWSVNYY